SEPAERAELMDRVDGALAASSDIAAAAFASAPPWGHVPRSPISATTEPPDHETAPAAKVLDVSSDLFATLELDLLTGRLFTATESADAGVAIVSRSLADRLNDRRVDASVLGRTVTIGSRRAGGSARRVRVVGVVADLGVDRSDHPDRDLAIYLPAPVPVHGTTVLIRRQPGPASGRERVEAALEHAAPLVGTLDELTVDQALAANVWVERRLGQIVSLFAVAALSVTAAGLYAVLAVMVRGRRRELGIRAAIGARPGDLQRLVLGETGRQLLLGLAAGALLSWWGSGWIDRSLTEGLEPRFDVLAMAALAVVLGCLVGSWSPTRNAARVDPARCLGSE
ncbi:MAG: FtsX-like permease family protein, partial [Acidobacteriota bacterium]